MSAASRPTLQAAPRKKLVITDPDNDHKVVEAGPKAEAAKKKAAEEKAAKLKAASGYPSHLPGICQQREFSFNVISARIIVVK